MSKGAHTKQSLAATAYDLLRRFGLHGTGLNELIAASGAPRGSIYYHFPGGKSEIVSAALEIGRSTIRAGFAAVFSGAASTPEKVNRLFKATAKGMQNDLTSVGCPVAAIALDDFGGDEALRQQCEQILADWRAAIAAGMLDIDESGRLPMAALVLSTYEGALISARTSGDVKFLFGAGRMLSQLIQPCVVVDLAALAPAQS